MRQFIAIWGLVLASAVNATDAELPLARDLRADARTAQAARVPILVFFAADLCPYCHEVEELYLKPMQALRENAGRFLLRVVRVDSARSLKDFAGRSTDHGGFAEREGIWLTPVVRFYGPDGRQLVPALIGYSSPDFYAGYLEQAIEDSLQQLRRATATNSASPAL